LALKKFNISIYIYYTYAVSNFEILSIIKNANSVSNVNSNLHCYVKLISIKYLMDPNRDENMYNKISKYY